MQRDVLLLTEMIDAAEQAQQLTARTIVSQLETDRQRRDALLWNFTVLGEAAGQLSAEVKDRFPVNGGQSADVSPRSLIQQLTQMLGCCTEVALPPVAVPVTGTLGRIQVLDHPMPHQHARLDTTRFGEPAQLLNPLAGQPQPIHRRPHRMAPSIRQIRLTRGLRVLSLGRDLVLEFIVSARHCSPLLPLRPRKRP
jgi:hypothetical protein